jgi:hypothetical protein
MLALGWQWFDGWRRAAALGWQHFDRLAALNDPRRLREWWLAELRRLAGDYAKSPSFLALMRFNLTLLTNPTVSQATRAMALQVR